MPVLTHTHSYVKWKKTKAGEVLYRCVDPHCTHFLEKSFLMGKASLCPGCGLKELILDAAALKKSVPLCLNCRNTKEGREYRASLSFIGQIFKEVDEL